jgi:PHD/YefM family antitoxin component YafN of YafNO toxin-antitoxin module
MQTMTVTDARAILPRVLTVIKTGGRDAVPILIGRHREPMAVLISVEQFYEYSALVSVQLVESLGTERDRGEQGHPPMIGA